MSVQKATNKHSLISVFVDENVFKAPFLNLPYTKQEDHNGPVMLTWVSEHFENLT